jgi:hypothetical protein
MEDGDLPADILERPIRDTNIRVQSILYRDGKIKHIIYPTLNDALQVESAKTMAAIARVCEKHEKCWKR